MRKKVLKFLTTLTAAALIASNLAVAVPVYAEDVSSPPQTENEEYSPKQNDDPVTAPNADAVQSPAPDEGQPDDATAGSQTAVNLLTYRFFNSEDAAAPASQQIVQEGDELIRPGTPTSTDGGTFTGWYEKDSEEEFTGFGTVGSIEASGTVDLYARFSNKVYIFYHDQQGQIIRTDEFGKGDTATINPSDPYIQVDPNTNDHEGWAKEPDGTVDVSGSIVMDSGNLDLYPIIHEGYWITFDTQGGTALDRQFIAADSADRKVIEKTSSRIGYTFGGWFTDPECTQAWDFSKDAETYMTLYAKWNPAEVEYAVRYYRQDPDDESKDIFVKQVNKTGLTGEDCVYNIPELPAEKAVQGDWDLDASQYIGYELDQERTDAAAVKISADGKSIRNVYLKSKTHTIRFLWTDEAGVKHDETATVKYMQNTRAAWDLVKPYDTFKDGRRWSWNNDGGVTWFTSYEDFSTMIYDRDIVMSMGGVAANNLFYNVYKEALDGVVPEGYEPVEVEGRTFYLDEVVGFRAYINAATTVPIGTKFNLDLMLSDGNIWYTNKGTTYGLWFHRHPSWGKTLESKWNGDFESNEHGGWMNIYLARMKYDIVFHENGGPALEDVTDIPYERLITQYEPSEYTKGMQVVIEGQDFQFAGWYDNAGLTGEAFDFNDQTMPDHQVDLYAKWVPISYTVTFDTAGGSPVDPIEDVPYGSILTKPEDPQYTDHIFTGWTLDGKPYSFESGVTRDITLVAQWKGTKAYTVTYDLNGGSGTAPTDSNVYYDTSSAVAKDPGSMTPPAGMSFTGWVANTDGQKYYPGSAVPIKGDTVLTAQWTPAAKTAELTYDFNFDNFGIKASGDTSASVKDIANNNTVTLVDIASLRTVPAGYVFTGWYSDKECTNGPVTELLVNTRFPEKNIVYAGWAPKDYTITYDPNGGTWKDGTSDKRTDTHSQDEKAIIWNAPEREGYTFVEWKGSSYQPAQEYNEKDAETGMYVDDVLVAQWKKNEAPADSKDKNATSKNQTKAPATGDTSNLPIWAMLAGIAAAGLVVFTSLRRKKKQG